MIFHHLFGVILVIFVVSSEGQYYRFRSNSAPNRQRKCEIKSNGLTSIEAVQEAINKARDGDIIRLDPIVYEGNLMISKNNQKYISIVGDNQCNQNTIIRGQITLRSKSWIINAIVFEKSGKALDIKKGDNIRLMNLVINEINGNAIEVEDSNDIKIHNLVVDNIANNAIDLSKVTEVQVKNAVISNVGGIALNFNNCYDIVLSNNVARNVVQEVIKITGHASHVKISQTVINGDSQNGQAWMWLEGDNYSIQTTVASGAPKNGIVVNGCNNRFAANICTNGGNGYCIYLNNRQRNCRNDIGITNLNSGGRGLYNI